MGGYWPNCKIYWILLHFERLESPSPCVHTSNLRLTNYFIRILHSLASWASLPPLFQFPFIFISFSFLFHFPFYFIFPWQHGSIYPVYFIFPSLYFSSFPGRKSVYLLRNKSDYCFTFLICENHPISKEQTWCFNIRKGHFIEQEVSGKNYCAYFLSNILVITPSFSEILYKLI